MINALSRDVNYNLHSYHVISILNFAKRNINFDTIKLMLSRIFNKIRDFIKHSHLIGIVNFSK